MNNDNYIELLKQFPPRPIKSDQDALVTQRVIDSLIDRETLTEDERDYLNVLGSLVFEWERQNVDSVPDIFGVELLKILIDDFGLKQKDLVPVFRTESIVSEVLNSKRKLTVKHIQKLGKFFNISPASFFSR